VPRIGEKGMHTEFWWRNLLENRDRLEYNIKIDNREIGCGNQRGIELCKDYDEWRALVSATWNFRVLYHAEKQQIEYKGCATSVVDWLICSSAGTISL
jgi:hypothetical protein